MIRLNNEYSYARVFSNRIDYWESGERDADGSHPGEWEAEGAIAAINHYGEVFWAQGVKRDYQELVNQLGGHVKMWDGKCYLHDGVSYYHPQKNSNRQIGDRPKIQATYRLNADLVEEMERRAHIQGITKTVALEQAIALWLQA